MLVQMQAIWKGNLTALTISGVHFKDRDFLEFESGRFLFKEEAAEDDEGYTLFITVRESSNNGNI